MSEHTADKIIESIAHVTTHADRDLLEASLMSTLFELLKLKRISLYKIISEYSEQRCLITTDIINGELTFHDPCESSSQFLIHQIMGLAQCMESGEPVFIDSSDQQLDTYVYPLTNRAGVIISAFVICGQELSKKANEKLLSGYFQIYRNYACLLDDSEHDTLTGLLNRRTFDRDLERILGDWKRPNDIGSISVDEISHPQRRHCNGKRAGNWLAVIDIDFFKKINDQYGHLYGDEVLLLLANIMRESFRSYDKLFRFGGEEFVVLLRSTTQPGAHSALERFRSKMENYDFPQIGSVTVSIGYVEIADQGIAAIVLGHADEALYYAKDNGRNQVCFHTELVAQGALTMNTPEIIESDVELF